MTGLEQDVRPPAKNPRAAGASRRSPTRLSIVCPVYNEAGTVPLFFGRLRQVVAGLGPEIQVELIFIDNCSTDATVAAVEGLAADGIEIYCICMARNFGYQSSLVAGLTHATGDIIVNIDVDCEDPPELIPRFVAGWRDGYDVVYGIRKKRPEGLMLTSARKLFYRSTRAIADSDFILDMAEFLLLTAEARDGVLHSQTSFPFIRSEVGYVGFRRLGIPYDRQKRIAGRTNYNLLGLFRFAVAGMLSSSTFPLRAIAYVGVPLAVVDVIFLAVHAIWPAPALIAPSLLLNAAFLVMSCSFLAIYLARTYKNGLQRPRFIVDKTASRLPPKNVRRPAGAADELAALGS